MEGLEPPASGFGDRRSSQLSYTPTVGLRLNRGRKVLRIGRSEAVESPGEPHCQAFMDIDVEQTTVWDETPAVLPLSSLLTVDIVTSV